MGADTTRPPWLQPEETKPAPMPLLVVQAFVNTYEADRGSDLLADADADAATGWLRLAGLLGAGETVDAADLAELRSVRESFRSMLAANAGDGVPSAEGRHELAKMAGQGSLRIGWDEADEVTLDVEAARPAVAVVLRLALVVRDAQRDGSWRRLKACSNDECRWAYYDRSHSRQGRWCDMSICGNRVKNRALRARRR